MVDKAFRISIERSRIYWDYYKSMFLVFSGALMAAMLCSAIIYTRGEISLPLAVGAIALAVLMIILIAALMSLIIWRHENKHFDELLETQPEEPQENQGQPLV